MRPITMLASAPVLLATALAMTWFGSRSPQDTTAPAAHTLGPPATPGISDNTPSPPGDTPNGIHNAAHTKPQSSSAALSEIDNPLDHKSEAATPTQNISHSQPTFKSHNVAHQEVPLGNITNDPSNGAVMGQIKTPTIQSLDERAETRHITMSPVHGNTIPRDTVAERSAFLQKKNFDRLGSSLDGVQRDEAHQGISDEVFKNELLRRLFHKPSSSASVSSERVFGCNTAALPTEDLKTTETMDDFALRLQKMQMIDPLVQCPQRSTIQQSEVREITASKHLTCKSLTEQNTHHARLPTNYAHCSSHTSDCSHKDYVRSRSTPAESTRGRVANISIPKNVMDGLVSRQRAIMTAAFAQALCVSPVAPCATQNAAFVSNQSGPSKIDGAATVTKADISSKHTSLGSEDCTAYTANCSIKRQSSVPGPKTTAIATPAQSLKSQPQSLGRPNQRDPFEFAKMETRPKTTCISRKRSKFEPTHDTDISTLKTMTGPITPSSGAKDAAKDLSSLSADSDKQHVSLEELRLRYPGCVQTALENSDTHNDPVHPCDNVLAQAPSGCRNLDGEYVVV